MALNADLERVAPIDHAELEADGPTGGGDPLGTPVADEKVLWKGRPDRLALARSAFHTRKVAIYFTLLVGIALATGNIPSAVVCAVLGVAGFAILNGLAWLSARTTLYILTDVRLIMRIGMALETRVNLPLKRIGAAHIHPIGKDRGDIALELTGERLLGYALLWPHARPWKLASPQPMLRALPDAQTVAELLAAECARYNAIERNLTEIKAAGANGSKRVNGPAASAALVKEGSISDTGLKGAPA